MKDLDPDDVCALIALARRFQAPERDGLQTQSQGDVPGTDNPPREGSANNMLAEEAGDPLEQEVRSLVQGLGSPQQHELVALMWLGRGDAEPDEFRALVRQAEEDLPAEDVTDYLLEHPLLAEYLTGGLTHFGHACDE